MKNKNNKNGSAVFRIICGGYLAYLGLKIVRGEGVGAGFIVCGILFIVVGGGVLLLSLFSMFKGGMKNLADGEEPDGNIIDGEAKITDADDDTEQTGTDGADGNETPDADDAEAPDDSDAADNSETVEPEEDITAPANEAEGDPSGDEPEE